MKNRIVVVLKKVSIDDGMIVREEEGPSSLYLYPALRHEASQCFVLCLGTSLQQQTVGLFVRVLLWHCSDDGRTAFKLRASPWVIINVLEIYHQTETLINYSKMY